MLALLKVVGQCCWEKLDIVVEDIDVGNSHCCWKDLRQCCCNVNLDRYVVGRSFFR